MRADAVPEKGRSLERDRAAIVAGELPTPLVVLDDAAIAHNLAYYHARAARNGFAVLPHGKTTMAPEIWDRQLAAGAIGLTLATPRQAMVAAAHGAPRIMIANAVADVGALRGLLGALGPEQELVVWADAPESVEPLAAAARATGRRIEVLVELGVPGGRTGARHAQTAIATADRIRETPGLRLAGVAGYEGAVAHDREEASLDAVSAFIGALVELHLALGDRYDGGETQVSLAGSIFIDLVEAALTADAVAGVPGTLRTLRTGAYPIHDEGSYRAKSPLDAARTQGAGLRTAMIGLARVLSVPEPGLAILDAGRRDLPYDAGLPAPLAIVDERLRDLAPLDAAPLEMNDQHLFVRFAATGRAPAVGELVRLGLSHPCTAFDKWRTIPVIASRDDPRVIRWIETRF